MEWIIKEVSLAALSGAFFITGFFKFNSWINNKFDSNNIKKHANNLNHHEKR